MKTDLIIGEKGIARTSYNSVYLVRATPSPKSPSATSDTRQTLSAIAKGGKSR